MFRDPFAVYVYTVEMIKLVGSRVPATLQARQGGQGQVVLDEEVDRPGVVQSGCQHQLGHDVLEVPISADLWGVSHQGKGGVVELLILVVEEDQLVEASPGLVEGDEIPHMAGHRA